MSASDDRKNPLGHIRFPHAFDPSDFIQQVEEATKFQSKIIEQLATYRSPPIDLTAFTNFSKRFDEMVKSSLDYSTRFTTILDASRKSWEQAQKTIQSIVTSSSFLDAIEHSHLMMERMSESLVRLPDFTEHLSILQDRVIFKDIVLPDTFMPPAGECREYGTMLPLEEIIREDLLLDPVEFSAPATHATSPTIPTTDVSPTISSPETQPIDAKPSAPLFLQRIFLHDGAEILEGLPEGAELIDEAIALYAPHKSGLLILVQSGYWMKEKDGVTPQSIEIVQYLRRIGKRTGEPWANATELAKHLAPDAQNIATGRRSIANRMSRLQSICKAYKCKPLFLKTGNLWRINTDLTRWDAVGFMPSYHNKKGH
jgi:hypothetical protein